MIINQPFRTKETGTSTLLMIDRTSTCLVSFEMLTSPLASFVPVLLNCETFGQCDPKNIESRIHRSDSCTTVCAWARQGRMLLLLAGASDAGFEILR